MCSPELCALLFVLIQLVLACGGFAEQAAIPPIKEPATVIVPYDPAKPVAQQKPDQFYLPYERFLDLWNAAKRNRAGVAAEPAPAAFVLSSARYDGRVGERTLAFTARIDLTTANERWVKVPLPFKGVNVSSLKIDGVAAAFDGAEVLVEKPGRHQVEVAFELPRGAQQKSWSFGVPRTTATLVALTLPDARTTAKITPGSGVIERVTDGARTVTAALGSTDTVQIALDAAGAAVRVSEPASATVHAATTITQAVELAEAWVEFAFPGAKQDRFTIFLDGDLKLVDLDAADLKAWKLSPDGARQRLELTLNEPAEERFTCTVKCERALPAFPVERAAAVFSAGAKRVESRPSLLAARGVEVTPKPDAGLRQVEFEWNGKPAFRVVSAFAGEGKLGYRAVKAEPRREARVDYVFQVNRRKIELIASLQLFAKGDDIFETALALPAQFEVQAVESARLRDWWREGDRLHVRFKDATPEMTPLVVYLVRQYAAAPTELDVRPLALADFKTVNGEAVIAAHKGVDVTMQLAADGKEIAPENAATDFQILPPLERKRGFTFKTQNFSAQVAITALPAKTHALWVLHAQAHEGWIALSTRVRLSVRQGSVDRAAFSLPAALAEARVTGGDVRETRSRIEGDRRVYEVQFQNDVYDRVEWTIDVELPNPGEAALPAIAFPDAQMTAGYVLTDNASEYEMKLKTDGVDPAPLAEIPFLPALTKSAGVHRAQPGWSVVVGLERLEKAASRAAFVAWAEITTALRHDGTEWHRASYRLQNRSLQFLPVRLPAGAELMSARVAGQSVRADAGKVGAGQAILIPLIKTKPGDLAYDVELIYRTHGGVLGWLESRRFDDPDLVGITVERTIWNVWLPDDRRLWKSGGNVEPVLAEVNRTDKLEGMLQEAKALSAMCLSPLTSIAVRKSASENFYRLKKSIEETARQDAEYDSRRQASATTPKPTPGEESVGKKGVKAQQEWVADKRKEINQVLGEESERVGRSLDWSGQVAAGQVQQQQQFNATDFFLNNATAQQPAQQDIQGVAVNGSGTVVLGERWAYNRDFKTAQPSTPTPAPAQPGNNLYLNDNVVLQQRVVPQPQKPASSESAVTAGRMGGVTKGVADKVEGGKKSELSALELAPDFDRGMSKHADGAVEMGLQLRETKLAEAEDSKAKAQDKRVLNTARGNAAFQAKEATTWQSQAGAIRAPLSQAATPAPQAPVTAPAPAGPPQTATAAAAPGGAGVATRHLYKSVDEFVFLDGGLQPQGRISLDVDFPTEGQVLHFKKVKSNAQIELRIVEPDAFTRWKWLGLALALGLVVWALAVWIERRARRKSAGAMERAPAAI